jgi:pimeloyl-ACP methyl ester carboxylesterase
MRPPLALLHGVGTNRAVRRRVTPLLAGDRRVAAPDLPGFGAAPPAGPGFALDEVADVLAGALEAELAAPFDVLGNSLGGAVALVLAERHPERIRRLVLAATAGLAPLRDPLPALAGRAGSALIAARRRAGLALAGSGAARRLLLFTVMADPARVPAEEARAMLRGSEGSQRSARRSRPSRAPTCARGSPGSPCRSRSCGGRATASCPSPSSRPSARSSPARPSRSSRAPGTSRTWSARGSSSRPSTGCCPRSRIHDNSRPAQT